MTTFLAFTMFGILLVGAGCTTAPLPIPIHDEPSLLVDVAYDARAGSGHSHPVEISQDQLIAVLRGLQLQGRDVSGTFGILGGGRGNAAFSDSDTTVLAPFLAAGLSKASPHDLVRFHLIRPGQDRAPLVTSGGIFVRKQHLYVILANARTSPSSVQYENTYEPNSRRNPLVPIARWKFLVEFVPADWRVPTREAKKGDDWGGYLDESKVVVVDLTRMQMGDGHSPDVKP